MQVKASISSFRDRLLGRTGYKARDANGKLVSGCGECCHNYSEPTPLLPAHRCNVSMGTDGKPLLILDPFNVPELCSQIVPEVKECSSVSTPKE